MTTSPVEILLVEDNPADADLTMENFADLKIANTLHHVSDGVEAMAFLRREAPYADAPRPDLVLLDLNLPRKDGREVLTEVKADCSLKRIPVIVLTSSEAETDVLKTYDLNANCYIRKPVDLDGFKTIVETIEAFWFSLVVLPPKNGTAAAPRLSEPLVNGRRDWWCLTRRAFYWSRTTSAMRN